jgi:hypothetical protein
MYEGTIFNRNMETIPIQLACARPIHKARGLTLERLAFDPTSIPTRDLVYIALSWVKIMEPLYLLKKLIQEKICVNKKAT